MRGMVLFNHLNFRILYNYATFDSGFSLFFSLLSLPSLLPISLPSSINHTLKNKQKKTKMIF